MQTRASKSCALAISSIESAITSREISDARMPGVPCDWLSETAIVLNGSGTPPAPATASQAADESSRWFRLHGIVPVQVETTPTIGPSSWAGSMPIARKCARAPARSAPVRNAARARLRSWVCPMARSYVCDDPGHGVPPRRCPAALRLRRGRAAEARAPPRRRGRDRPRLRQSRRAAGGDLDPEGARGGVALAQPPLQRKPRPAEPAGRDLRALPRPLRRRPRSRVRSHDVTRREGGAGAPALGAARPW